MFSSKSWFSRIATCLLLILLAANLFGEWKLWEQDRAQNGAGRDTMVLAVRIQRGLFEMERAIAFSAVTGDRSKLQTDYRHWLQVTHDALFELKKKVEHDPQLAPTVETLRRGIGGWDFFTHRLVSPSYAQGPKAYYTEGPALEALNKNLGELNDLMGRIRDEQVGSSQHLRLQSLRMAGALVFFVLSLAGLSLLNRPSA